MRPALNARAAHLAPAVVLQALLAIAGGLLALAVSSAQADESVVATAAQLDRVHATLLISWSAPVDPSTLRLERLQLADSTRAPPPVGNSTTASPPAAPQLTAAAILGSGVFPSTELLLPLDVFTWLDAKLSGPSAPLLLALSNAAADSSAAKNLTISVAHSSLDCVEREKDVFFLVDMSSAQSETMFTAAKAYYRHMATVLANARIGIVTFADDDATLALAPTGTLAAVQGVLDSLAQASPPASPRSLAAPLVRVLENATPDRPTMAVFFLSMLPAYRGSTFDTDALAQAPTPAAPLHLVLANPVPQQASSIYAALTAHLPSTQFVATQHDLPAAAATLATAARLTKPRFACAARPTAFSLDLTAGTLRVSFSATVDPDSIAPTAFRLHPAAGADSALPLQAIVAETSPALAPFHAAASPPYKAVTLILELQPLLDLLRLPRTRLSTDAAAAAARDVFGTEVAAVSAAQPLVASSVTAAPASAASASLRHANSLVSTARAPHAPTAFLATPPRVLDSASPPSLTSVSAARIGLHPTMAPTPSLAQPVVASIGETADLHSAATLTPQPGSASPLPYAQVHAVAGVASIGPLTTALPVFVFPLAADGSQAIQYPATVTVSFAVSAALAAALTPFSPTSIDGTCTVASADDGGCWISLDPVPADWVRGLPALGAASYAVQIKLAPTSSAHARTLVTVPVRATLLANSPAPTPRLNVVLQDPLPASTQPLSVPVSTWLPASATAFRCIVELSDASSLQSIFHNTTHWSMVHSRLAPARVLLTARLRRGAQAEGMQALFDVIIAPADRPRSLNLTVTVVDMSDSTGRVWAQKDLACQIELAGAQPSQYTASGGCMASLRTSASHHEVVAVVAAPSSGELINTAALDGIPVARDVRVFVVFGNSSHVITHSSGPGELRCSGPSGPHHATVAGDCSTVLVAGSEEIPVSGSAVLVISVALSWPSPHSSNPIQLTTMFEVKVLFPHLHLSLDRTRLRTIVSPSSLSASGPQAACTTGLLQTARVHVLANFSAHVLGGALADVTAIVGHRLQVTGASAAISVAYDAETNVALVTARQAGSAAVSLAGLAAAPVTVTVAPDELAVAEHLDLDLVAANSLHFAKDPTRGGMLTLPLHPRLAYFTDLVAGMVTAYFDDGTAMYIPPSTPSLAVAAVRMSGTPVVAASAHPALAAKAATAFGGEDHVFALDQTASPSFTTDEDHPHTLLLASLAPTVADPAKCLSAAGLGNVATHVVQRPTRLYFANLPLMLTYADDLAYAAGTPDASEPLRVMADFPQPDGSSLAMDVTAEVVFDLTESNGMFVLDPATLVLTPNERGTQGSGVLLAHFPRWDMTARGSVDITKFDDIVVSCELYSSVGEAGSASTQPWDTSSISQVAPVMLRALATGHGAPEAFQMVVLRADVYYSNGFHFRARQTDTLNLAFLPSNRVITAEVLGNAGAPGSELVYIGQPRKTGDVSVAARFYGKVSKTSLQFSVVSDRPAVRLSALGALVPASSDASQPFLLSSTGGAPTQQQLTLSGTLESGQQLASVLEVPGLVKFSSSNPAAVAVDALTGVLTLVANTPGLVTISAAAANASLLSGGTSAGLRTLVVQTNVASDEVGSVDVGPLAGSAYGSAFVFNVSANTAGTAVGSYDLHVLFDHSKVAQISAVDMLGDQGLFSWAPSERGVRVSGLINGVGSSPQPLAQISLLLTAIGTFEVTGEVLYLHEPGAAGGEIGGPVPRPFAAVRGTDVQFRSRRAAVLPPCTFHAASLGACTDPQPCDMSAGELVGDINGDCYFSMADVDFFWAYLEGQAAGAQPGAVSSLLALYPGALTEMDVDRNGQVTFDDMVKLHHMLTGSLFGVGGVEVTSVHPRSGCAFVVKAQLHEAFAYSGADPIAALVPDAASAPKVYALLTTAGMAAGAFVGTEAVQGSISTIQLDATPASFQGLVLQLEARRDGDGQGVYEGQLTLARADMVLGVSIVQTTPTMARPSVDVDAQLFAGGWLAASDAGAAAFDIALPAFGYADGTRIAWAHRQPRLATPSGMSTASCKAKAILLSFSADMDAGELRLTFSHALGSSALPPQALVLQANASMANATSAMPPMGAGAGQTVAGLYVISPTAAVRREQDGLVLVVALTEEDLNAVKVREGLFDNAGRSHISIHPDAAGTILDARGTVVEMPTVQDALAASDWSGDKTPPTLVAVDFVYEAGKPLTSARPTLRLEFSEAVRLVDFTGYSVRLQEKEGNAKQKHVLGLSAVVSNTSLGAVEPHVVTITVSAEDEATMRSSYTLLGRSQWHSWLRVLGNAVVKDFAGLAFEGINTVYATRHYNVDWVLPTLERFDVDLMLGRITLSFSERIDLDTLDLAKLEFAPNSGSARHVLRSGETPVWERAPGVVEMALSPDDYAALAGGDSPPLSFALAGAEGAVHDFVGNPMVARSLFAFSLVAPTDSPKLLAFVLDMDTGTVALTFNEPVGGGTATVGAMLAACRLQGGPAAVAALSGVALAQGGVASAMNAPLTFAAVHVLSLPAGAVNAIKANTELGVSLHTSFLSLAPVAGELQNGAGENLVAVGPERALLASGYAADATAPVCTGLAVRARNADGTLPVVLELAIDEPVLVGGVDPTKVTVSDGTADFRLTGGNVLVDGTGAAAVNTYGLSQRVLIELTDADMAGLRILGSTAEPGSGILQSQATSAVALAAGWGVDAAGNAGAPVVSVPAASHNVDFVQPRLLAFDLNMATGEILLSFSESVRPGSSQFDVTKLRLVGGRAGPSDPARPKFRLRSAVVQAASGRVLRLQMAVGDVVSILRVPELAISANTSYLQMEAGAGLDLAGNPVVGAEGASGLKVATFVPSTVDVSDIGGSSSSAIGNPLVIAMLAAAVALLVVLVALVTALRKRRELNKAQKAVVDQLHWDNHASTMSLPIGLRDAYGEEEAAMELPNGGGVVSRPGSARAAGQGQGRSSSPYARPGSAAGSQRRVYRTQHSPAVGMPPAMAVSIGPRTVSPHRSGRAEAVQTVVKHSRPGPVAMSQPVSPTSPTARTAGGGDSQGSRAGQRQQSVTPAAPSPTAMTPTLTGPVLRPQVSIPSPPPAAGSLPPPPAPPPPPASKSPAQQLAEQRGGAHGAQPSVEPVATMPFVPLVMVSDARTSAELQVAEPAQYHAHAALESARRDSDDGSTSPVHSLKRGRRGTKQMEVVCDSQGNFSLRPKHVHTSGSGSESDGGPGQGRGSGSGSVDFGNVKTVL